jgi:hypothetical protein
MNYKICFTILSEYCPCYYGYITSSHQGRSRFDLQLPVAVQSVPLLYTSWQVQYDVIIVGLVCGV